MGPESPWTPARGTRIKLSRTAAAANLLSKVHHGGAGVGLDARMLDLAHKVQQSGNHLRSS